MKNPSEPKFVSSYNHMLIGETLSSGKRLLHDYIDLYFENMIKKYSKRRYAYIIGIFERK